MISQFLMT